MPRSSGPRYVRRHYVIHPAVLGAASTRSNGVPRYIQQRYGHGFCCHAIALFNSRIFLFDEDHGTQSDIWFRVVDITRCTDSPASWESVRVAAEVLGLNMVAWDKREEIPPVPAIIPITTKLPFPHVALVIETRGQHVEIVNYKGWAGSHDPVQTRIWGDLRIPGDEPIFVVTERSC